MKKVLGVRGALTLVVASGLAAFGCSSNSPSQPSSPSTAPQAASPGGSAQTTSVASAGALSDKAVVADKVVVNGITITTPQILTPTSGQQFQFAQQPLTLAVKNAVATGSTPLTYGFQVANDAGFTSIAYSKDGVAEGSGGQTSVTVDVLPGPQAKTYFVHVRAVSGSQPGLYSAPRQFGIGPQVVIQAPVLTVPAPGGTAYGVPTLTWNDAAVTGPKGPIVYRVELSDSASFTNLVFVAPAVAEQPGQTSVQVTSTLTTNRTYYCRIQASDPTNNVTGPFSSPVSFNYISFDLHQAIMVDSPYDFADWAETGHITSVVFTGDAMLVDFDKRDGPDRWIDTPFGSGTVEYTLGMCLNINNQWYCAAIVQFWYGRELTASGAPWDVANAWFYDHAAWGPMAGYQPQEGETVGFFACAGNCRRNPLGDRSYIKERTNVALVPFTLGQASYAFSNGKRVILSQSKQSAPRQPATKRR